MAGFNKTTWVHPFLGGRWVLSRWIGAFTPPIQREDQLVNATKITRYLRRFQQDDWPGKLVVVVVLTWSLTLQNTNKFRNLHVSQMLNWVEFSGIWVGSVYDHLRGIWLCYESLFVCVSVFSQLFFLRVVDVYYCFSSWSKSLLQFAQSVFLESFGTRILHGFAVDFESTCTGTTPL